MFVGQHSARGSQCGGVAERGLHLRQRTARAALRNSGSLRQPLPARDAPESRSARRLLAQGALLVTTSYPDRTSPVLRGKWLLNNIFGTPIPPPPPGVNATLETKPGTIPPTMRERLAQHRTQSIVQQLPFRDRSARVFAGEFRRDRRMAHHR